MRISEAGLALIKSFEGCKLEAYPDPKTGGDPWTIGFGHAGSDVKRGMVITQADAERLIREDVSRFEDDVNSLIRVPVTQGQFDALVSFAYNCGSDIDADTKAEGLGDSTLLRKLNEGDYLGAADEFPKWISKGSAAEAGLRRRRKAEQIMFLGTVH